MKKFYLWLFIVLGFSFSFAMAFGSVFPTDAISKFVITFPSSQEYLCSNCSVLGVSAFRDGEIGAFNLGCMSSGEEIYYFTPTESLMNFQCPDDYIVIYNDLSSNLITNITYVPYTFSTSTERYGFTNGESILSLFLFMIVLGGFLTFIIDNFMIKKIKW